jgi:hypothetical protein
VRAIAVSSAWAAAICNARCRRLRLLVCDLCVASYTGSGLCNVDVGAKSSFDCTGSGGCDVVCAGDCDVGCPGSGECRVHCATGAICNVTQCSGNALTCTDGTIVCGDACP